MLFHYPVLIMFDCRNGVRKGVMICHLKVPLCRSLVLHEQVSDVVHIRLWNIKHSSQHKSIKG